MAHSSSALSFLLVLVLFSLVKIEARESKFFAKAVVIHANATAKNVTHHVEPPSAAPSPSPLPVEAEIDRGYGLYGRDEIPNTRGIASESLFENKIPTEEFEEKFSKDEFDNNGLPSNYDERSYVTVPRGDNKEQFGNEEFNNNKLSNNYNERSYVTVLQGDNMEKYGNEEFNNNKLPNSYNERSYVTVPQDDNMKKYGNEEFNNNELPSNYNEHSYVTVPQGYNKEKFDNEEFSNSRLPNKNTNLYDTKSTRTPTNYENEFTNNEEKLTPEEEKLFEENRNYNERNEKSFVNSNEPQKFRDTPRYAEIDNYFNDNHNHNGYNNENYNVGKPQGLSDTRTLENGKYHYALKGGPGSPPKYYSEGYYGNNGEPKSKYEFDTMEEFEKQEGFSQIPGEYINP